MKPFVSQGRGAASPRSPSVHSGGLSMAFAGDSSSKKRGLSPLNTSTPADGFGAVSGSSSASGDVKQQAQQQQCHLPAGGLSSQLGSGGFPAAGQLYSSSIGGSDSFGSCYPTDASPALSPLSATTPHGSQRSPLSEALAISAFKPRSKVPRRGDASSFAGGEDYAALASDESDDDFAVNPSSMRGGGGMGASQGGWAITGPPPHMITSGAMSLPQHAAAAELYTGGFRPGSVMEGAGRKLRGTEAMRMRNAVLRQTGFLEPNTNNMFADHTSGTSVLTNSPILASSGN